MDPCTPSKEQRKLLQKRILEQQQQDGEASRSSNNVKLHQAASVYYFGGAVPNTPHSTNVKALEKTPTNFKINNNYATSPNTGSSSSSSCDEKNLSTLSDTTELTASNFVFAASARQRWAAALQSSSQTNSQALGTGGANAKSAIASINPLDYSNNDSTIAQSPPLRVPPLSNTNEIQDTTSSLPPMVGPPTSIHQHYNSATKSSLHHPTSNTSTTPLSHSSPSMRSRIVANVDGLLRLTSSLKKGRQQRQLTGANKKNKRQSLPPASINSNSHDTTNEALGGREGAKENNIPHVTTTITTTNVESSLYQKKKRNHDDAGRILTATKNDPNAKGHTATNTLYNKDSPARDIKQQQKLRRLSTSFQNNQILQPQTMDYDESSNQIEAHEMTRHQKPIDSKNGDDIRLTTSPHQTEQLQKDDLTTNTTATIDSAISITSLNSLLNDLPTIGINSATNTKNSTNKNSLADNEFPLNPSGNYSTIDFLGSTASCHIEDKHDDAKYNNRTICSLKSTYTVATIDSHPRSNPIPSTACSIQQQDEDMTVDSAVSITSLKSLLDGLDQKEQEPYVGAPASAINNSRSKTSPLPLQMIDSPARNTRSQRKDVGNTGDFIDSAASSLEMRKSTPSKNTKAHWTHLSKDTAATETVHINDSTVEVHNYSPPSRPNLSSWTSPVALKTTKQATESLVTSPTRYRIIDTSNIVVFDSPSRSTRLQKDRLSRVMLALDNSATKSVASSSSSSSSNMNVNDNIITHADESQMSGSTAGPSSVESLLLGQENTNEFQDTQSTSTSFTKGSSVSSLSKCKSKENDVGSKVSCSNMSINGRNNLQSALTDSPARNTRSSVKRASLNSIEDKQTVMNRLTADTRELRSLLGEYHHVADDKNDFLSDTVDEQQPTVDLRDFCDLFELTVTSADSSTNKEQRASLDRSSRKSNSFPMKPANNGLATINEDQRQEFLELALSAEKLDAEERSECITNKEYLAATMPSKEESSAQKDPVNGIKSILNTGRNQLRNEYSPYARKTVAFGSPEAAEYNLGSPSVNMTPIPPEIARVRFSIPRSGTTSSSSSGSVSRDDNANTMVSIVPLESDINALLLTAQSSCFGSSPASAHIDNIRDTIKPVNLHHQSEGRGLDVIAVPSILSSPPDSSTEAMDCDESLSSHDERASKDLRKEHTVELEDDVLALLKSAEVKHHAENCHLSSASDSPKDKENMDISFEEDSSIINDTDSASISLSSFQQDFDARVADKEFTVELEGDVRTLLASHKFLTDDIASISKKNSREPLPDLSETTLDVGSGKIEATAELDCDVEEVLKACMDVSDITSEAPAFSIVNAEAPNFCQRFEPELSSYSIELDANPPNSSSDSNLNATNNLSIESPDTPRTTTSNVSSVASIRTLSIDKKSPLLIEENFRSDATPTMNISSVLDQPSNFESPMHPSALLTSEDLMALIPSFEPDIDDYFMNSYLLLSRTADKEVIQATSSLVVEASAEIEKMVAETSCEGQKYLSHAIETNAVCMGDLQRKLQNADLVVDSGMHDLLKGLADAVRNQVEGEWSSWETQLTEALMQTMDATYNGKIIEDIKYVENGMKTLESAKESVSIMNRKAVKRARRRSLNRRKAAVSLILEEIKLLEIEQQDVVANQKSMKKYLDSLGMLVQLKKNHVGKDAIMQKRCVVESSEKRYKMQEALSCWLPKSLSNKELVITFPGGSMTNSSCVEFKALILQGDKNVDFKAVILPQEEFYRQHCSAELRLFWNRRLVSLCQEINEFQVPLVTDLQCILQRLEWKLCRLDMICREISSLQCKYEVRLEKIGGDDDDTELISILFIGKRQSTKLRVFFNIYESYPNAPLDIHIQTLIGGDKFDTDALYRFLQNSVSPGFSYATRLCYAVKSYLD